MANRRSTTLDTIVGLLTVVAFASMVIVRQYYTRNRPEAADASAGRTIAVLVNYGKTVYVTALEWKILYGSYILVGVAFATVTAIVLNGPIGVNSKTGSEVIRTVAAHDVWLREDM